MLWQAESTIYQLIQSLYLAFCMSMQYFTQAQGFEEYYEFDHHKRGCSHDVIIIFSIYFFHQTFIILSAEPSQQMFKFIIY